MNEGIRPYLDTRIAANIFKALPKEKKSALGMTLLADALRICPYNPDIWYRLAQYQPDAMHCLNIARTTFTHRADPANPAFNDYWHTVQLYVAQTIFTMPVPKNPADMRALYLFLRAIPGIRSDELTAYVENFAHAGQRTLPRNDLEYDRALAERGDSYGQFRMGERYANGEGVSQNESQARKFYALAAAQGDMAAALAWGKLVDTVSPNAITVTASSAFNAEWPQHLIDGSGLAGIAHDNDDASRTMWHTAQKPAPRSPARGLLPSPAWVRFDFSRPRNFVTIMIWNHNQLKLTDRGFRKTRIYGLSEAGGGWRSLTQTTFIELPRAAGTPYEEPVIIPNAAANESFKAVIIAADMEAGNYGSDYYGLSAVRFGERRLPTIPSDAIKVSASSTFGADQSPQHLVDGAGMTGNVHDNDDSARTMWHTTQEPALRPRARACTIACLGKIRFFATRKNRRASDLEPQPGKIDRPRFPRGRDLRFNGNRRVVAANHAGRRHFAAGHRFFILE